VGKIIKNYAHLIGDIGNSREALHDVLKNDSHPELVSGSHRQVARMMYT